MSAAAPPTVEYQSPSRYESELETARLRWLRKRFGRFCAVLLVLSAIWLPVSLSDLIDTDGFDVLSAWVDLGYLLVSASLVAAAWWYARRRLSDERRITRLAGTLVIVSGLLGLAYCRASVDLELREHGLRRAAAVAAGEDPRPPRADRLGPDGLALVGPERPVNRPSLKAVRTGLSVAAMLWAVFSTHFFACLFLPWRVREAMWPAAALLAGAAMVVSADVLLGRTAAVGVPVSAVTMPLAVLPGIGWCWWRYSRYRKSFRHVLEGRELRQLRHELDSARRIHESCLPPHREAGPLRFGFAYEPMSAIGGDLLYAHPRPGTPAADASNHQTLVVLDVTGHGVAAALTVNRLVGELERVFAERPGAGPCDVIAALNRYVYLTLATHDVYVTGLALRVDAGDDEQAWAVRFCSAGHPTAFVRRSGWSVEPLESTTTMLGVLPPEMFEADETSLCLAEGEALVTYTDGLAEARRDAGRGEMIGIAGVREMVGDLSREKDPQRWPEAMLRRLTAERDAPPEDDTLIAVIHRPVAERPAVASTAPADVEPRRVRPELALA